MCKSIFFAVLFVFLFVTPHYPQWSFISPTYGKHLYGVSFSDANNGWVCGYKGLLRKTTNGGKNWIDKSSPIYENYSVIHFINPNIGWLVRGYTVLKTTDAGESWEEIYTTGNFAINIMQFSDSVHGRLCGTGGNFMKTSDGGRTWTRYPTGTNKELLSMNFTDDSTGWLSGVNGLLFKTTNAGVSWAIVNSGTTEIIHTVHFINKQVGYFAGSNLRVRKTTDGGNTWTIPYLNLTEGYIVLHFYSADTGIAVSQNDAVYKTVDGGQSWTRKYGITREIRTAAFKDSHIAVIGRELLCMASGDYGETWQQFSGSTQWAVGPIQFFNDSVGYAPSSPMIYTSDGGENWGSKTISNRGVRSMYLQDSVTAWAACDSGEIRHTTNAGDTWVNIETGFTDPLMCISFADSLHGWCSAYSNYLLKTSDGGRTWMNIPLGSEISFDYIHFFDSTYGYGVRENYNLMRTTDGGQTWIKLNRYPCAFCQKIFLFDKKSWCLYTTDNDLYRTKDGGLTFKKITPENYGYIRDVDFIDSLHGYLLNSDNVFFRTTDGGMHWDSRVINTLYTPNYVKFFSPNIGWISGGSGFIAKTTNGGITFVDKTTAEESLDFEVQQNYPNPFNPETKIAFTLQVHGLVNVSVYNVIGKKVKEILNRNEKAGKHEITFNASDLPSGVYFYTITFGHNTITKKMLLLK